MLYKLYSQISDNKDRIRCDFNEIAVWLHRKHNQSRLIAAFYLVFMRVPADEQCVGTAEVPTRSI